MSDPDMSDPADNRRKITIFAPQLEETGMTVYVSVLLSHCLVTHPSDSDSFATLALYKLTFFTYLLTYFEVV